MVITVRKGSRSDIIAIAVAIYRDRRFMTTSLQRKLLENEKNNKSFNQIVGPVNIVKLLR